jgi:cytochrome c oxidase subunit 4
MSTTTDTAPVAEDHHDDDAHPEHPSDWKYVQIALILGFVTALEVLTYFFEMSTLQLVVVLFPMMIFKFLMVIFYFMHLKYDNPLFKRVFLFGLLLAISVFTIALFAFEFWSADYLKFLH